MKNAIRQLEGAGKDNCGWSTDATFKLIKEGHTIYSCGCRSVRRIGDDIRLQYRPFSYLLSRTERSVGYDLMFTATKYFLFKFENVNVHHPRFIVQDHFSGLIKAAQGLSVNMETLVSIEHESAYNVISNLTLIEHIEHNDILEQGERLNQVDILLCFPHDLSQFNER